jgi:hypothetical protein
MAVEYTISVPPFEAVARDNVLTLSVSGVAADEPNLLQQADQIARDLVRCFSYRLRKRFDIVYGGYQRQSPDRIDGFAAVVGARAFCLAGTVDVEVRDRVGNVVDSSAMRRERDQQAIQHGLSDLTKRAARDANLRDMLDHWGRYVADPDGRLHPLYDVLQVAERLYKGRENAAAALNLSPVKLLCQLIFNAHFLDCVQLSLQIIHMFLFVVETGKSWRVLDRRSCSRVDQSIFMTSIPATESRLTSNASLSSDGDTTTKYLSVERSELYGTDRFADRLGFWISSGIFFSPSINSIVGGFPPPRENGISGYMRTENQRVYQSTKTNSADKYKGAA